MQPSIIDFFADENGAAAEMSSLLPVPLLEPLESLEPLLDPPRATAATGATGTTTGPPRATAATGTTTGPLVQRLPLVFVLAPLKPCW